MSSKAVQSWYRHKRNELRPSLRKKVCEAAFRFVAYTFLTIFGAYILKDVSVCVSVCVVRVCVKTCV